ESQFRRAIEIDPGFAPAWVGLAESQHLNSQTWISPVQQRAEALAAIEKAIALDPQNGFAYHVYGVWHRKMAEIGKMSRMFASVIYGRSIPTGSMEKSIEYLNKAVALNPTVIASRLELARSYVAMENWLSARSFLTSIEELPVQFSDDAKHKQKADQLLREIEDR
ncbi:MAG TPA: hypothetical protein VEG60_03915, partial [Candidatus Binatia bacterium]|nr:hypothetical protein [Candidatus Binatia bacterium]